MDVKLPLVLVFFLGAVFILLFDSEFMLLKREDKQFGDAVVLSSHQPNPTVDKTEKPHLKGLNETKTIIVAIASSPSPSLTNSQPMNKMMKTLVSSIPTHSPTK